jgi:predicted acyl esterase
MILKSGKPNLAYILGRVKDIVHPPVQVTPLPPGIRVEKDVKVPLRDGVHLAVNVYRPEGPRRYPVVMCAHPYGKDHLSRKTPFGYAPPFTYRIMRQPSPVRFSDQTGWEAPDPARWVPRGYIVINADLRGFFHSEGAPGVLMSDQEAQDYYDLIEWAAVQPWSDGNVGLNGVSYLAISQWKVAALNPPHLKAICPWEGLSDLYKDLMYPGGIREDGFAALWGKQVKSGVNVRTQQLKRPTRDEWFRSLVPDLKKITVPALICGSFSDQNLHTRGSFRAFEQTAHNTSGCTPTGRGSGRPTTAKRP